MASGLCSPCTDRACFSGIYWALRTWVPIIPSAIPRAKGMASSPEGWTVLGFGKWR